MLSPERSDVDIKKLLIWGKQVDLTDSKGNIIMTIYMRIVGDGDIGRSRVFGLRKSAELRKKMKDHNSDEYFAYIPDFDGIEKENIINAVLLSEARRITPNYLDEKTLAHPKELNSEATLEEQEIYQKAVDDFPKKLIAAAKVKVDIELDKLRKTLNKRTKEDLYDEYTTTLINSLCENEMYQNYIGRCISFSAYTDPSYTVPLFYSFDEFDNLPSEIKNQLIDTYDSLDIDMDTLKK